MGSTPAHALILYGRTNAENLTPPASGAPWAHGTRVGAPNASGVYLGNGYVITANHVDMGVGNVSTTIVINNVTYTQNTAFTPCRLSSGNHVVDAKVFRINGDPGLPVLPIAMNGVHTDTSKNCTIIAWGVGKGNLTSNTSANTTWSWNGVSTQVQRWGTNRTEPGNLTLSGGGYQYNALLASQDILASSPNDEAAMTIGDSGGGLFISYNGTWRLAGIATDVSTFGASTFSGNPMFAGSTRFVRLAHYAHLLRFDHWRNHHLGNATAPYTGDNDSDGLPNLLEYAFDGNPALADANRAPVGGFETVLGIDYVTVTYWHRRTTTDIALTVEESTDAVTWSPATVTPVVLVGNSTDIPVWRIKARVPAGSGPRKLLRVKVTLL